MNIGLVVNARGKMCLVHDEPFEATPLWVGYHVDKRQLEIIFDTGGTLPIEWEATDEMDGYLLAINKILLIRMENKKPVEGYDTSFLLLRGGRTTDGFGLRIDNGMIGDDRQGQLVLRMGSIDQAGPPCAVTYDGLTRKLLFRWDDGTQYAIGMSDDYAHSTILSTPDLRIVREARTDTQGRAQPGFDVWLPIGLSMRGDSRPADSNTVSRDAAPPAPEPPVEAAPADAPRAGPVSSVLVGAVKWFDPAKGHGFVAPRGMAADIFVHLSEVTKAGLSGLAPGDVIGFEIRTAENGRQAAVNLRLITPASRAAEGAAPCAEWNDPAIWRDGDAQTTGRIRAALSASQLNVPFAFAAHNMRLAALPYYDDALLVHLADKGGTVARTWFGLYSPSRNAILHLDGTNVPIHTANETFGWQVDEASAVSYVRFFFHFVHPENKRFLLVGDAAALPWRPEADVTERVEVEWRLVPMHRIENPYPSLACFVVLEGTVVFLNSLFLTKLMVALCACNVFDPAVGAPESFTIGQLKFFDEKLLLEELNLHIDPPAQGMIPLS